MAAKENLTKAANIDVTAREVDFVTRFTQNWEALQEVLGIANPIKKTAGTKLTAYTASVTLEDSVGEGEEIPYSLAEVEPVEFADLTIEKYAKAVSIEAVEKYGARIAVQKTDEAFLNELQSKVLDDFYAFLTDSGTATAETYATFQMGVAMAIGNVKDYFKKLHKTAGAIVVFVNTLDAYAYLGAANISVQTAFGIDYVKNFLGADTVILSSEIEQDKIYATAVDNIDLYYIDPSDSDFAQLGLVYTVQGETNLIGFHANGNYSTAVGESYALMGMKLWAEYLDGIAEITVDPT